MRSPGWLPDPRCLLAMLDFHDTPGVSALARQDQVVECSRCGLVEEWATGSSRVISLQSL